MSVSAITSNNLPIRDPLVSGQPRRQPQASTVGQMEAAPQAAEMSVLQAFQQISAFAPDNTGSITSGNTKAAIQGQDQQNGVTAGSAKLGNPVNQGPLPPTFLHQGPLPPTFLHQGPLPPTYGHYLSGPPDHLPLATANSDQQVHYLLPTKPDLQLAWSTAIAASEGGGFDLQA